MSRDHGFNDLKALSAKASTDMAAKPVALGLEEKPAAADAGGKPVQVAEWVGDAKYAVGIVQPAMLANVRKISGGTADKMAKQGTLIKYRPPCDFN